MRLEVGQGHVIGSLSVPLCSTRMQWGYSKVVQGVSAVVRVLFWRNHSGSSMEGTRTAGMGVVVIIQVKETEGLFKSRDCGMETQEMVGRDDVDHFSFLSGLLTPHVVLAA